MWDTILFVVLPYVSLAIFIVGHIWRYRDDQFGWTTRTSQLLERRWLAWGSPIFHVGALLAIIGHAGGLLIPESWTNALGISEDLYHVIATTGGVIAGLLLTTGLVILLLRRFLISDRIRVVTRPMDWVLYALLTIEIVIGMWQTLAINVFGAGHNYRGTVSVWFRQVIALHPDPAMITAAPAVFGWHAVIACLIIAIWPFTRLVHVWSIPVAYLARPFVVYRQRSPLAAKRPEPR